MRIFMRILLSIVLVAAIITGTIWYLTVYDRDFTHDMLLSGARYFEKNGYHEIATWLYDKAYIQSDNSEDIALELAEYYRSVGNYTKVEETLNRALEDGGGAKVYVALSRAYVEQNKLLDALRLIESIEDSSIRQTLEKQRPAAPTPDQPAGHYDTYISVGFASGNNKVYVTSGEFPSADKDLHKAPVTLTSGENLFMTLAVGENGLVSPLTEYRFTVIGVIEPVVFTDSAMEQAIREAAGMTGEGIIYTNELWAIRRFTIPKEAKDYSDLKFLPFLTELHIDSAVDSLEIIKDLSELTVFSLHNTPVSSEMMDVITGFTGLQKLTLHNCSLTSLSGIERLTELTYLDVGENVVRNLAPLSGLTKLQSLYLNHNAVVDLSALATLHNLRRLDVSFNSVSTAAHIAGLTNLEVLNLSTNLLTDVYALASLTNLTHLDISCNKVSAVSVLSVCKNLTELNISNNEVSDILSFSALTKLEIFNFSHNKVVTLPTWPLDCALHTIDGSYNDLYSIKSLAGLDSLNRVIADYNKDVSDVNSLSKCPVLYVLSVYGTKVRDISQLAENDVIVYYDPT